MIGVVVNSTAEKRFWRRVVKGDGCWEWTGTRDGRGYGQFRGGGTARDPIYRAHRFAWYLVYGEMLPRSVFLCHRCDNRLCVRPSHLFIGTAKDNTQDMMRKGRDGVTGEKSRVAKLTERTVREIRQLHAEGLLSQQQIADNYGISQTNVGLIVNRKAWRHVA